MYMPQGNNKPSLNDTALRVREVAGNGGWGRQNLKLEKFTEYLNACVGLSFPAGKKVASPSLHTCTQQEGLLRISKAALNYFLCI